LSSCYYTTPITCSATTVSITRQSAWNVEAGSMLRTAGFLQGSIWSRDNAGSYLTDNGSTSLRPGTVKGQKFISTVAPPTDSPATTPIT